MASVLEVATAIGVDPKTIRRFLRSRYGNPPGGGRWDLSPAEVQTVRNHFRNHPANVRWSPELESERRSTSGSRVEPATPGLAEALREVPSYLKKENRRGAAQALLGLQQQPPPRIYVHPCDGEPIPLHQVVWTGHEGTGRGSRGRYSSPVYLLSNGRFIKEDAEALGHVDPNYFLSERSPILDLQPSQRQQPSNRPFISHHKDYIACLTSLSIPLRLVPILLYSTPSSSGDTPQGKLIDFYSDQISEVIWTGKFMDEEVNSPQAKLADTSLGSHLDLIATSQERVGPLPSLGPSSFISNIHSSLERYFATVNIIKADPSGPGDSVFSITLGEVYKRFHYDLGVRAEKLQEEVAAKYGFKKVGEKGWRKSRGEDQVLIDQNLRVYINSRFICIVSAVSTKLPFGDEVARRMITVATEYRNKISTIGGEQRASLERLFSDGSQ